MDEAAFVSFLGSGPLESEEPAAVLVGKDGGEKDRRRELDLERIFGMVDAMPMRRREMEGRSGER